MPSCPPGSSERPAAIGHGHDRARVSTGGETGRMSTSFLPALVGSMSESAAGNPTGVVMEAAFRHHGLDWRYINLEVAAVDLGAAVAGARAMGFRGFNCSMPHKQTVIAHLDGLTRSAELVGAVNCVIRRPDDRLIGTNTDGVGFLLSLRDVVDPVGQHVVVLGAGGAARAVAVELALAGAARIDIVNRTRSRGDVLAATIAGATATGATSVALHEGYEIPAGTGVVVNATSVGLYTPARRLPIAAGSITSAMVVADVVFNPVDTLLLRTAADRGARIVDGLGMLVNQAAEAVRLWTGVDPDRSVMASALREAMALG